MTYDEARSKLIEHFAGEWATANPTVPVQYPNTKKVTPSAASGAWARLRVIPGDAQRVTIGGASYTRVQSGRVVLNVFVPLGTADGTASAYARSAEAIWETAKADGLDGAIHLGASRAVGGFPDPNEPFWTEGISTPFLIDHTT